MVTLSGIYTKLIFFFSKRLIFHELYELEYRLWRLDGYSYGALLCDVMREINYIKKVFKEENLTPEALYTFWGHTECLKEEYISLSRGHGHTDFK